MQKTYGLAVEKPHALVALDLPLMTLTDAKKARKRLKVFADIKGDVIHVINRHAQ